MVVEKPVPGVGVDVDVVVDALGGEDLLELPRDATQGAVLAAVAGNDGAGVGQRLHGLGGQGAVVDTDAS